MRLNPGRLAFFTHGWSAGVVRLLVAALYTLEKCWRCYDGLLFVINKTSTWDSHICGSHIWVVLSDFFNIAHTYRQFQDKG